MKRKWQKVYNLLKTNEKKEEWIVEKGMIKFNGLKSKKMVKN